MLDRGTVSKPRHWKSWYKRLIANLENDLQEILNYHGSEGIHTKRYQKQASKLERVRVEYKQRQREYQRSRRKR